MTVGPQAMRLRHSARAADFLHEERHLTEVIDEAERRSSKACLRDAGEFVGNHVRIPDQRISTVPRSESAAHCTECLGRERLRVHPLECHQIIDRTPVRIFLGIPAQILFRLAHGRATHDV